MRTLFLLFIMLLCFSKANSQKLSGAVVDSDNKPISFLNVVLYNSEKQIDYAITDEQGKFIFENLTENEFVIEISSLGFKTYREKLAMPNKDLNLGTIILKNSVEKLDDVTITAKKPVVDIQPDKTVLNVDQMATVAGDNTLELLRRAPGVRLDNNDNVIVEGKSGITYYINGRQTYLSGDDLNNYLRSLTSDDIESIELITQPSSKYDAAGSGGVINIVLKRIKGQGIKANVASRSTLGNFPEVEIPIPDASNNIGHQTTQPDINPKANTTLNFNYISELWDFAGNLSNNIERSTGFVNLYRFQGNKVYDDRTNRMNDILNNTINLRSDYRINDKNTIGASINANLRENESQVNNRTPIIDQTTMSIDSILIAPNQSDINSLNLSTNLNYRYKDTLGNTLTADLDYGKFTRNTDNRQPNFYINSNGEQLSERINAQETGINIDIYAVKSDYETKIWGNQFSAGFKYSLVATDNDFDFFNVMENDRVLNDQRSNRFLYDEQIRAGYVNYSFDILSKDNGEGPELKSQVGLRAEQTVSKGDLRIAQSTQDQVVERDYLNWFPSGGITYKPSRAHSWSLTYSRRIQRPNYNNLNPFEFQFNELSGARGNPFLQPQYIDNLKLSHTYKYKLTTSLSYSYISDFFARITKPTPIGGSFLVTENVADQEIWNLSINRPFKFTDKFNGYASAYATNNDFLSTDPSFISLDQFTYGGYAQLSYTFDKSWTVETSGWYSGPTVWGGTYQTDPLGSLSVALEKKWNNWTAKLNFSDVLYTRPWNATTVFPELRINGSGGSDTRRIQFYLSYSFGQDDVKKIKSRESGSKDEQSRIE